MQVANAVMSSFNSVTALVIDAGLSFEALRTREVRSSQNLP
jgi:hypothetical protein